MWVRQAAGYHGPTCCNDAVRFVVCLRSYLQRHLRAPEVVLILDMHLWRNGVHTSRSHRQSACHIPAPRPMQPLQMSTARRLLPSFNERGTRVFLLAPPRVDLNQMC